MALLGTTYQKKSFWLTSFILSLILLLLFFVGLRYLDPPIENGILVAFGSEAPAQNSLTAAPAQNSESTEEVEVPVIEEVAEEQAPIPEPEVEEVLVTETSEVVVPQKKETDLEEKSTELALPPKEASDATKAALANILGAKEATGDGVGQGKEKGNEGLSDGSLYANSYYGSATGTPNAMGFGLAGRSLLGKGAVTPDCNEEGRVVVAITVDPLGNVIAADAGVRGTTNNAPCLLKPATATAFMYKWAPDPKAPPKQIGFVVVNFKLGQ